jgi:hypothetical protein
MARDLWASLLANCYIGKNTAISEADSSFELDLSKGETLLWFSIDNQTNPQSNIKQEWEIQNICDYLGLYTKHNGTTTDVQNHNCVLMVELKGQNVEHALNQLKATYQALKKDMLRCTKHFSLIVIHTAGRTPDTKKLKADLKDSQTELEIFLFSTGQKKNINSAKSKITHQA